MAELPATASVTGPPSGLGGRAMVTGEGGLGITASIDGVIGDAIRNRGEMPQCAGYLVFLDGAEAPPHTYAAVSCGRSLDNSVQAWTWDATMPAPAGSISERKGPPPGVRRVDIFGAYLTSRGRVLVPLIVGGIVDSASASYEAGVATLHLSGVDAMGRYDEARVEENLPPGHGLQRGAVVRRLAAKAGAPAGGGVAHGGQSFKPIVLTVDGDWVALAREIMATDGLVVLGDRYGRPATRVDGGDPGQPIEFEFDDYDLEPRFDLGPAQATAPTRLKGTGQAQVLRDGDAVITDPLQIVYGFDLYAVQVAPWRQEADGSLTPTEQATLPAPALPILVSMTELYRTRRGQTEISSRTYISGWHNPEVARYVQHADGTRTAREGVYILAPYADPAGGDDKPAFALGAEVFTLTNRSEAIPRFDIRGFRVELQARSVEPHLRKAALQTRDTPSAPWEYIEGRYLLGNGSGVADAIERMPRRDGGIPIPSLSYAGAATQVDTTSWTVTDDGYIVDELQARSEYWAPDGSLYLYAGEDPERSVEIEAFSDHTDTDTAYLKEGEGSHTEIVRPSVAGRSAGGTITTGLDSSLPAAERDISIVPPADLYDTPEQAAAARAASRLESVEISAEVVDWEREGHFGRHEPSPISVPWAETAAEVQAVLLRELREAGSIPVSFSLCYALFTLSEGAMVTQRGVIGRALNNMLPTAGIDPAAPVRIGVRSVSWPRAASGVVTTSVQGRIYL